MKNKILILIIGILIGSVITTSAFLIYNNVSSKGQKTMKMERKEQMEPPSNGNMKELPERPNQNGEIPPEMPSNSNNNNNV